MNKRFKILLSTTQTIIISFLLAIVFGSILLVLPISSVTGKSVSYIDALFTATTSICVTGLVTVPTYSTWSTFGHIVILVLIQVGGLGVITIMSGVMLGLHKRIGIGKRMLIQDAFNLNSMSGIVIFLRKVIIGTIVVEAVGAIMYMTVFVPRYGIKGIWYSIFNSISAFCNAGMDIIGDDSLCRFVSNPIVNITTCILIILGGIGYIVWWDIVGVFQNFKRQGIACLKHLSLHSKIAILVTAFFVIIGACFFFVFEYNNPLTMKELSFFDKIQASIFQSVTTRTAGFATIPQQDLTQASAIVSVLLMIVGGSPTGTAGGVKTVTIAVLFASAFATLQDEKEVVFFKRKISKEAIGKAVSVVTIFLLIFLSSTILLAANTKADGIDVMYETVSATATVGLTRNLTPILDVWGKLIIIVTMYLGRVGPISLFIAFNTKKGKKNIIGYPEEEISVG